MNNATEIYMAGFFDGEGYVGMGKRLRGNYTEYFIQISIGQNDGKTMDWIKDNFGGNVYLVKRDNSYYWTISNKAAYTFLKRIEPYLKYKRPQALLAIEFCEGRQQGKKCSEEEKERRENLYLKLKEAKKTIIPSTYCK